MAYEVIDSAELAKRWSLPESWVRDQVRARITDPIPCVRLGKYVRFEWGSSALEDWWDRRRTAKHNGHHSNTSVSGVRTQ